MYGAFPVMYGSGDCGVLPKAVTTEVRHNRTTSRNLPGFLMEIAN